MVFVEKINNKTSYVEKVCLIKSKYKNRQKLKRTQKSQIESVAMVFKFCAGFTIQLVRKWDGTLNLVNF